jgi:hypothetical protein
MQIINYTSETAPVLGGTFTDFNEMGYEPRDELRTWARSIWEDEFDESNNPRWWHKLFCPWLWVVKRLRRIDLVSDGSVLVNTLLYSSTKTGRLTFGERIVFW